MILNLLEQVAAQARERAAGDQEKLGRLLEDGVGGHVQKLGEEIAKLKRELDELYKEKAKHITTEDIHEGFDSKVRHDSFTHHRDIQISFLRILALLVAHRSSTFQLPLLPSP